MGAKGINRWDIVAVLALLAIFSMEFLMFREFAQTKVIPYYPTNHDQTGYLRMVYYVYFSSAASLIPLATGLLFVPQATAFFLITGASRFNALLLNFIYFIILQSTVFFTAKRLSGSCYFSFLALGLLLTLGSPFLNMGGIFDFRIDFIALCLYGIFVSFVLVSGMFSSRRWTIAATVVAVLLVYFRLFTIIYFALIYCLMLIYFKVARNMPGARSRVDNLFLSGFIIACASSLVLVLSRREIYNYYVIGHILGPERQVRAFASADFISYLSYYPKSLLFNHIGLFFALAVAILAVALILLSLSQSMRLGKRQKCALDYGVGVVFLTTSSIAPLIVLTADELKSPVVAGIVTPAIVWLACWILLKQITTHHGKTTKTKPWLSVLSVTILLLGLYSQTHYYFAPGPFQGREDMLTVNKMYIDIGDYAVSKGWYSPHISADSLEDYLAAGNLLTIIYYENKSIYLNSISENPTSIFSASLEKVMGGLKRSDFVIISDSPRKGFTYPYDDSINMMRPAIREYLNKNYLLMNQYRINSQTYSLYVNPNHSNSS